MALDRIDNDHLNKLLFSLERNKNDLLLENIQRNHVEYGQLKLISKQIQLLKQQAIDIINQANINTKLLNIKCNFKLTCGNKYYLYNNNDDLLSWSLINPCEWSERNYKDFLGEYLYDYDKSFQKC